MSGRNAPSSRICVVGGAAGFVRVSRIVPAVTNTMSAVMIPATTNTGQRSSGSLINICS
jgi:hypothetical protein